MDARKTVERKIREVIVSCDADCTCENVKKVARLSNWQDTWKKLPIPDEYRERHEYDWTDNRNEDFLREVLEVYDLYPDLRDRICSMFEVQTDEQRKTCMETWRFVIRTVIAITELIIGACTLRTCWYSAT